MTKSKAMGGMSFRDLAMLNNSLLAKQAWRLLHNHNTLFYKVFKARFFPNTTIMEAKDSRLGSYAWRSILIGRDVIQRGPRSRVGNGKKKNQNFAGSLVAKEAPSPFISLSNSRF